MAHSGKTITFATDLLPNEDKIYSLGSIDKRWKVAGATFAGPINQIITGTGTAGGYISSKYCPAKWTFNIQTSAPTDGDVIIIKIPVAGHDYGIFCSTNNGTNYYPVALNGTARCTTQYPVDTYLKLIFEAGGSAASMFALDGQTSSTRITVTGGVWRVMNYYDSGNSGLYQNYTAKAYKVGTTATTAYDLLAEDDSGFLVSAHKFAHRIGSPIFICSSALSANATGSWAGLYDRHYSFTIRNSGTNLSLTTYAPVFLKGTISGGTFTPDTTTPFICTRANCNVSGAYYMYIGDAVGATAISFSYDHPYYYYNGNGLVLYTEQAENAKKINNLTVQTAVPENAIFTDTHHTAYLYAGANNATAHAAVSSGSNIYLCLRENGSQRSAVQIKQGSNMTISSDANGVITFASSYTNNAVTQNVTTADKKYGILLSAYETSAITTTATSVNRDSKVYVNPSLNRLVAGELTVHDKAASPIEKVSLKWNSTDQSLDFIFL